MRIPLSFKDKNKFTKIAVKRFEFSVFCAKMPRVHRSWKSYCKLARHSQRVLTWYYKHRILSLKIVPSNLFVLSKSPQKSGCMPHVIVDMRKTYRYLQISVICKSIADSLNNIRGLHAGSSLTRFRCPPSDIQLYISIAALVEFDLRRAEINCIDGFDQNYCCCRESLLVLLARWTFLAAATEPNLVRG